MNKLILFFVISILCGCSAAGWQAFGQGFAGCPQPANNSNIQRVRPYQNPSLGQPIYAPGNSNTVTGNIRDGKVYAPGNSRTVIGELE